MQLEIRHLKLVTAIADTGSVTRAGNRLHLTQSALSHQLRDAEEQLGVRLFERRNSRMIPTSAGERLLLSASAVLSELERMELDIKKNGASAKGLIRMATQCTTVYHWFPSRLVAFQKRFPEVEVHLVIEATNNPFEALLEGKLDLAIISDPIRNRKIRYTPLFADELVVIVPPGHRLAKVSCAAPEDFAGESILVYPPREESTLLTKYLEPAGIRPRKVQEVMLTEAIITMVIGGLGIAALPKWAVGPQLASGAVIGLPLKAPGFRWNWSIAELRANSSPAYVQEFMRVLAERPMLAEIRPRMPKAKKRASPRKTAAYIAPSAVGRDSR